VTVTTPEAVRNSVRSTNVSSRYCRDDVKLSTGRRVQCPALGSRRRPNTDGESKRGTHHQSIEHVRSTRAADVQSERKA
jgi:hypothetical protein